MTSFGINVFKHSFKHCLFGVLQLLLAISQNVPKGSLLRRIRSANFHQGHKMLARNILARCFLVLQSLAFESRP